MAGMDPAWNSLAWEDLQSSSGPAPGGFGWQERPWGLAGAPPPRCGSSPCAGAVSPGAPAANRCQILKRMDQTRVIMVVCCSDGLIFSCFVSHCFSDLGKADFSLLCR